MIPLIPLALALLAGSPSPARPLPAPAAGDTCALPSAADTISAAVVATLEPLDPADSLPAGYARQFLSEVARRLVLPDPLPLAAYRRIGPLRIDSTRTPHRLMNGRRAAPDELPRDTVPGAQGFRVLLGVRLADGGNARVRVLAGSLTPAADRAALAAVQRLIADGLVTSLHGRPIETLLRLHTVDSVRPRDVVLFRYRTPRLALVEAAVRFAPAPRYPGRRRMHGEPGASIAEFVVAPEGTVMPGTLAFVSSSHRDFERVVAKAVPGYRFLPATVGGCSVPQLVEMPFVFSVR